MERSFRGTGFTLIELVVVMAIVGILAATALPAWFDNSRTHLDITRRRIVTDLVYAREVAIERHEHVSAIFDLAGNAYRIYLTSTGTALTDPSDRNRTLAFALDGRDNSGGVRLEGASVGSTPGLRFNSTGAPCDTGGSVVDAPGAILLSSGAWRDTIRIEARTGYVR